MEVNLPIDVRNAVDEVFEEFKEGDITKKGAVKRLRPVLAPLLPQSFLKRINSLDAGVEQGVYSDAQYYGLTLEFFEEFMASVQKTGPNKGLENEPDHTSDENNKNVANRAKHKLVDSSKDSASSEDDTPTTVDLPSDSEEKSGNPPTDGADDNSVKAVKISVRPIDILTGVGIQDASSKQKDASKSLEQMDVQESVLGDLEKVSEHKETLEKLSDDGEKNCGGKEEFDDLDEVENNAPNRRNARSSKIKSSNKKMQQRSILDMFSSCPRRSLRTHAINEEIKLADASDVDSTSDRRSSRSKATEPKDLTAINGNDDAMPDYSSKLTEKKDLDECTDLEIDHRTDDCNVNMSDSDECEDFEGFPSSKRRKVDEPRKAPKAVSKPKPPPVTARPRCPVCRQVLDSDNLRVYEGHPEGAVEEFIALTDNRLSLFTGEEDYIEESDERPQHKLTAFTVYDKEGHICPFDGGLIERNVLLYTSGVLKPIYAEDPTPADGVPAMDVGPINEWWISGFDGGEKALLGFSTGYAEYVLMEPSEAYKPYVDAVMEKIHLSKLVIEFLYDNEEGSYEDLLHKLQTAVPPQGVTLSEDSLLRHAQFVCEQVRNFDLAGDGSDVLLTHPCLGSLVDLAGVTLGKRCALRSTGPRLKTLKKMPKWTKATTTALVRQCFDKFFAAQIDSSKGGGNEDKEGDRDDRVGAGPRRMRCGMCDACLMQDCGSCTSCKDMVKFGGSGKSKQCCKERKCPNMMLADPEDDIDVDDAEKLKNAAVSAMKAHRVRKTSHKLSWVGEPFEKRGKRAYYASALVNGDQVTRGDCVQIEPDPGTKDLPYIARVISMWQDTAKKEMCVHADWFCRGKDTVLGDTSDPLELFWLDDCEDIPLASIMKKVRLVPHFPPPNWAKLGGIACPQDLYPLSADDTHSFFCQMAYVPKHARFVHLPDDQNTLQSKDNTDCPCCNRLESAKQTEHCVLGDPLPDSKNQYCSVQYLEQLFNVGDSIFIHPTAYKFKAAPSSEACRDERAREVDEELFPEYYRITSDRIKGSNDDTSEPFMVARITAIKTSSSGASAGKTLETDAVTAVVRKFYRPENTHRGREASFQAPLNLVYWSEEEASVPFSAVCGKCSVMFGESLTCPEDEFFLQGPYRFTFTQAYDPDKKALIEPPRHAVGLASKGKGKGKGKGSNLKSNPEDILKLAKDAPQAYPNITRRLRTLDVFSGCGGLSEGFHQAGVAESCWAIEVFEPAANAFKLNNPNATVFTDDCNLLLTMAMEGAPTNGKGQKLPCKGEVELLCGGPPCQGFSGMNRFNSRQYSQFKNSLVASYLSYCDFYRPRFFLLENVRNFVSYKCSAVLQLTLRVLILMGYQCTFGILQAGSYGVAQTRRRAIVLAAAPGEQLPLFPEPIHSFAPRACTLSAAIGDVRYQSNCRWSTCGPLRTITVRDTLSDLQAITNGGGHQQVAYCTEPESHMQRLLRGPLVAGVPPLLQDHCCKSLSALVAARMQHIPTAPGSDWRMLPNKPVRLADGSWTRKLEYNHDDVRNGRSSEGQMRGVCACASGEACDPLDRQHNTLIPWCLPHTANRHNNWAGLYGRLEWDGFFSTTVTNPEPMGKQGRVLHPEQHRVVSVRECARSQGFPDTYRFYGSIVEKHRQVGNAVPPPMARAIGLEIRKCVAAVEKKEQSLSERVEQEEE